MIDIKQEELDKAFLDGVTAAEDTVIGALREKLGPNDFVAASQAIYAMLIERVGQVRLDAIQGPNERGSQS